MCVCVSLSEVSSMDGVPLKMPQGAPQEVKEDVKVIVPDYLSILRETEVSVFPIILKYDWLSVW